MLCYGLNQGYGQFGLALFYMHDVWMQPMTMLKYIPGNVLEGPAFMGWWGGVLVTHKHGLKTYFDGNRAIQQGHDAGYFIPHLLTPPSMMMFIHMIFSKHKVMWPITSVDIEGKPMGTYLTAFFGLVCSNPVSIPSGALVNLSGTVTAGMSWKDFFLGLTFIAIDVAIDAIWSLVFKADRWAVTPGKYKLLLNKGFSFQLFKSTPLKTLYQKIFNDGMTGRGIKLWSLNFGYKLLDHALKSWGFSPLVAGSIFQAAVVPASGLGRKELPGIAVGRSQIGWSFFPWGRRGNLFN
jgi:hypothetical protein